MTLAHRAGLGEDQSLAGLPPSLVDRGFPGDHRIPSPAGLSFPAVATSGHLPTVARSVSTPAPQGPDADGPEIAMQRADDTAPSSEAPAGSAGPPGAVPTGDKELDELARRLYDRIRSRLRGELLVDRERAGLLSDLG